MTDGDIAQFIHTPAAQLPQRRTHIVDQHIDIVFGAFLAQRTEAPQERFASKRRIRAEGHRAGGISTGTDAGVINQCRLIDDNRSNSAPKIETSAFDSNAIPFESTSSLAHQAPSHPLLASNTGQILAFVPKHTQGVVMKRYTKFTAVILSSCLVAATAFSFTPQSADAAMGKIQWKSHKSEKWSDSNGPAAGFWFDKAIMTKIWSAIEVYKDRTKIRPFGLQGKIVDRGDFNSGIGSADTTYHDKFGRQLLCRVKSGVAKKWIYGYVDISEHSGSRDGYRCAAYDSYQKDDVKRVIRKAKFQYITGPAALLSWYPGSSKKDLTLQFRKKSDFLQGVQVCRFTLKHSSDHIHLIGRVVLEKCHVITPTGFVRPGSEGLISDAMKAVDMFDDKTLPPVLTAAKYERLYIDTDVAPTNDVYQIRSVASKRCLGFGGKMDKGRQLVIQECYSGLDQGLFFSKHGHLAQYYSAYVETTRSFSSEENAINATLGKLSSKLRFAGEAKKSDPVNLCIDIKGGNPKNGTTVAAFPCNKSSTSMRWHLTPQGLIKNGMSQKCLDVRGRRTKSGTPVQIWDCVAKAKNQQWQMIPRGYRIKVSQPHSDHYLGQVTMHRHRNSKCSAARKGCTTFYQKGLTMTVSIKKPSNPRYGFRKWASGPCKGQGSTCKFKVTDHSDLEFTMVDRIPGAAMAWQDMPASKIVSQANAKCFDNAGLTKAYKAIQSWKCHTKNIRQLFRFIPAGKANNGKVELFKIRSEQSMQCLGTHGGNNNNGGHIIQVPCNSKRTDLVWYAFNMNDDNWFSFRNRKTNKCMDLKGGGQKDGTDIQQWACDNRVKNQRFKVSN